MTGTIDSKRPDGDAALQWKTTTFPGCVPTAASQLAGESLDTYSQDELMARIALLEAEIARVKAHHAEGRLAPQGCRRAVQTKRNRLMGRIRSFAPLEIARTRPISLSDALRSATTRKFTIRVRPVFTMPRAHSISTPLGLELPKDNHAKFRPKPRKDPPHRAASTRSTAATNMRRWSICCWRWSTISDAAEVMTACGVDLDELGDVVRQYLDQEYQSLKTEDDADPQPTAGFQRVIQRAILHVQSSGKDTVTGANVLVALFSERDSYAVYFLQQQDMSRLDAVSFISHGIGKGGRQLEDRSPQGAEEDEGRRAARKRPDKNKKDSALDQFMRQPQPEGAGRQGRSADRPRARSRPHDPDPVPPLARTTRSMSAIPASARPPSPKAWRARSSKATCPKCWTMR